MYLVAICIFILKLEPSLSQSELFPKHTDLQKVGEVIFNNEKYNILRVTTHVISDYFKDFMLRRESKDIPFKRLFVDDNSFRHYWTGFDGKTQSLRKTEILTDAFDATNNDNATDSTEKLSAKVSIVSPEGNSTNSNEDVNKRGSPEENASDDKKSDEKTMIVKEIDRATLSQLRDGAKSPSKNGPERNVVKTTFFCPFFGVITMAAFVD